MTISTSETVIIPNDLDSDDETSYVTYLECRGYNVIVAEYGQMCNDSELWEHFTGLR